MCRNFAVLFLITEEDFATARAKASRSGELELLCGKDEDVEDLNFRSVPELEKDFAFFTELNGAAVKVDAAGGTAMTRLRRPG